MAIITRVVPENYNITSLVFTGEGVERFSGRLAGQFLRVSVLMGGQWSDEHPFTISNPPGEDEIQVTVKAVGAFTTSLRTVTVGTEARVRGPYGTFCKDIGNQPRIIMIAGGIGITPFLSVLRHFRNTRARNTMTVFWSNNLVSDIIRRDELREISAVLDLKIVHVLWKEERPQEYAAGTENECFERGLLTPEILRRHADIAGSAIYLCGPPKMNEHVLEALASCGIDPSTVNAERFVYTPPSGRTLPQP